MLENVPCLISYYVVTNAVFLLQIMKEYAMCYEQPRVLGLTAPLLNSTCDPGRLEGEIRRLEMLLHSTAETASDIVSVLRYVNRSSLYLYLNLN